MIRFCNEIGRMTASSVIAGCGAVRPRAGDEIPWEWKEGDRGKVNRECPVEMMRFVNREAFFNSRKGAKAQSKTSSLRLCAFA
jgi:hypothetical protein